MKKIAISRGIVIQLKSLLKKFKKYKNFSRSKKNAFKYTTLIGIKVCPYCNINYVYTVYSESGNEILRPDLDHFVSQFDSNEESLNWKNLIPSCQQCNSRLKLSKKFDPKTHLHPYLDDFDSIKRIAIFLTSINYLNEGNFKIVFIDKSIDNPNDTKKADRNIIDFKLIERYQHHKDEVVNIFANLQLYHKNKREEIAHLMNDGYSLRHLLLVDSICEINKTSLGKLKRDIINTYK